METSLHKKLLQKVQSTRKPQEFCPWFSEVLRNVVKDFAKYANIYFVKNVYQTAV